MRSSLLALLSAASLAVAYPDYSQWSPAGPDDVRSPCPALNSLANHGIIPHDGKGLTVPMLVSAMGDVYNIAADLATTLAIGGLLTNYFGSTPSLSLSFDLDMLDKHNFIEHDASLSRPDYNQGGDDHTFSQDIFNTTLAFFDGNNSTDIPSAGAAHYSRVKTQSASDPDFTYGPLQFILSNGESALYLSGLGDPANGVVPVEYVEILFEQERIPYNEGWRTPSTEIGFLSANSMVSRLVSASGEPFPTGLDAITNSTLARALLGLDPIGSEISGAVEAFLSLYGLGDIL